MVPRTSWVLATLAGVRPEGREHALRSTEQLPGDSALVPASAACAVSVEVRRTAPSRASTGTRPRGSRARPPCPPAARQGRAPSSCCVGDPAVSGDRRARPLAEHGQGHRAEIGTEVQRVELHVRHPDRGSELSRQRRLPRPGPTRTRIRSHPCRELAGSRCDVIRGTPPDGPIDGSARCTPNSGRTACGQHPRATTGIASPSRRRACPRTCLAGLRLRCRDSSRPRPGPLPVRLRLGHHVLALEVVEGDDEEHRGIPEGEEDPAQHVGGVGRVLEHPHPGHRVARRQPVADSAERRRSGPGCSTR